MKKNRLEESCILNLDYKKLRKFFKPEGEKVREKNIIPVVVQDMKSREVLILAYANKKALYHSLENGIATFWSTSRNELWVKGMSSDCILKLIEIRVNCEQNSLLFLVRQTEEKGACHTRENGQYRKTCFYRKIIQINNDFALEKIEEGGQVK